MKWWIRFILTGVLSAAAFGTQAAPPALPRMHQYTAQLASAGQPARKQFEEIELSGYVLVVNLAPPNYPGALADERQLVEAARMKYVHIPVDWDKPSLDALGQFFDVMEQNKGKQVLVHCWANSRASAFVYLYRTLREGAQEQAEFEILTRLWNMNRNYELENSPQWRSFLEQARLRFKK